LKICIYIIGIPWFLEILLVRGYRFYLDYRLDLGCRVRLGFHLVLESPGGKREQNAQTDMFLLFVYCECNNTYVRYVSP